MAKVQPAAGLQGKVLAAEAVSVVSVRLLSHAAKAKRRLPLKEEATSTMMKAASRTLIAKMQTAKLLRPDRGRSVQEATVLMVAAEIVGAVVAGIAEVVAVVLEVAAIVVLVVAAEI